MNAPQKPDKDAIRELMRWNMEAFEKQGIFACVVAEKLAEGDVEGARAALPDYLEQRAIAEGLGDELARLAGFKG